MIKNWQYHELYMDFSSMFDGNDHPSDIDMFYLCNDGTLILGEIKSVLGKFNDGQRNLLAKLIQMHGGEDCDGVGLFITHDKLVQNGDKVVDVSRCWVSEIYIKKEGVWRKPKKPVTVSMILNYYRERAKIKMENMY